MEEQSLDCELSDSGKDLVNEACSINDISIAQDSYSNSIITQPSEDTLTKYTEEIRKMVEPSLVPNEDKVNLESIKETVEGLKDLFNFDFTPFPDFVLSNFPNKTTSIPLNNYIELLKEWIKTNKGKVLILSDNFLKDTQQHIINEPKEVKNDPSMSLLEDTMKTKSTQLK